jgi:glutamate racemase
MILSLGESKENQIRERYLKIISKIQNDDKKLDLMVVLCNLIMDYEGPN